MRGDEGGGMSLAAIPSGLDHGTTRVAPGVSARHLDMAANVTALIGLSAPMPGRGIAAGLGNGEVVVFDADGSAGPDLRPHGAAVTGLVGLEELLFSTAQDGQLLCHDLVSGTHDTVFTVPGQWLWALAVAPRTGQLACAAGRSVMVIPTAKGSANASDHRFTSHPSSVSGLAFSPDGKRLAVSHYDGVTIWPLDGSGQGDVLRWKGFHIGVSWSPDGRFVVSATQERELHVWDLVTGKDFRLGGYPAKTHALAWTSPRAGPLRLTCSGADVITAWPFGDGGPGGLPPVEIGYVYTGRVTTVAPHGSRAWVAGGYTTGTVLVGGLQKGEAAFARIADGEEISALDWASGGEILAAGTRRGSIELISIGGIDVQ